ncbi:hypothetical protein C8R46DRAFT_1212497 [Mycena filopes]|nr:hypothetical protein C8R46DRAFT_1212497 [Mycena filopes]
MSCLTRMLMTAPVERTFDVPFPDLFISWSKSGQKVMDLVAEHWPTPPNQLPGPNPRAVQGQSVEVSPPKEIQALEEDGLPCWLAMRFAHIIPIPLLDELLVRTTAVHLGVWDLFGLFPRITADSLQNDVCDPIKRAAVLKAMDAMLQHLNNKIVTKIAPAMDEILPEHMRLQDRLRVHAQRLLRKEFAARPALNFGGCSSPSPSRRGPIRIPLRPGSVLAARTRLLAHCATEVSGEGRRVVFTCFTDNTSLEGILKDRDFAYVA